MSDAAFKAGYAKIDWKPLPPVDQPIRQRPARSSLPCPMIIRDSISEMQSMADGQWYDSKSALRRSYTADGNPQGRDYTEIGGTEIEPAGMSTPDKAGIRDAVDKALHDVKAGNVPEHIRAIE